MKSVKNHCFKQTGRDTCPCSLVDLGPILIFLLIFWKNESRPSRLTQQITQRPKEKHLTCDLGDHVFFRCLSLIL